MSGLRAGLVASSLLALVGSVTAYAACDPAGADAAAIVAARDAIDTACPCAAADDRAAYRTCANQVVRARVAATQLAFGCRRDVLRHAKLSICGRPGTVVCCRIRADGRTRHRVVSDPASCVANTGGTACISTSRSVPTGCDASGCIPVAVCGNGTVEQGEDCDPTDYLFCDGSCHAITCDPPPTDCGNGTIDQGETCEPPGVEACGRDCQAASCAAPALGEIGIACDLASTSVGVGATTAEYLVAWSGVYRQPQASILVRRFDANGAPIDPGLTDASADAPCSALHSGPAMASDGQGFYAVWNAYGTVEIGAYYEAIYGRRIDAAGTLGSLDQLGFHVPFGQCRTDIFGPTMAAGVSPGRFAVGWNTGGSCFPGGLIYQNPTGRILDFNPSPMPQSIPLGFGLPAPPPGEYSASAASVGSVQGDTMWIWHAVRALTIDPPYESFIAFVGANLGIVNPPIRLTSRMARVNGRPSIAPGDAISGNFLVSWGQGATDAATAVTEIRAVRASLQAEDGRLDPDGGLLLATTATEITGGPVVAFDGTRWLVAWAEASGATHDLRAVAVDAAGMVLDASPRLVASNVTPQAPAAASAGDGRVLVVFARPEGATYSVRATLVTP